MQQYHHFEQSHGELLTPPFTVHGKEVKAVGTYGCHTCMCVYIRFKNDNVFVAHIVAAKPTSTPQGTPLHAQTQHTQTDEEYKTTWTAELKEGGLLRLKVLDQLRAVLGTHSDDPVAEAFLVCPAIWRDGDNANGSYIKKGLEDFFVNAEFELRKGHGFVAGPGVETVLLQWEETNDGTAGMRMMLPEHYDWTAANGVLTSEEVDEMLLGPWGFVHLDGQWEVGD